MPPKPPGITVPWGSFPLSEKAAETSAPVEPYETIEPQETTEPLIPQETTEPQEPQETTEPLEPIEPQETIEPLEKQEATVIYNENGQAAYALTAGAIMEIFHESPWWQSKYAEAINAFASSAPSGSRTFSMLIPTRIEFDPAARGLSDSQAGSVRQINEALADGVIKPDVYSVMEARADEYVYFRTDNHWTALGAYYAYEEFCHAAGFTPVPPDAYNEYAVEGMEGLFWDHIPQPSPIQPDTLRYYVLKDESFAVSSPLIDPGGWYYAKFLGGGYGDYYYIETSVKNGRTAIVVKDSFAHCFAPFLAPHYERIVLLDPRYLAQRPGGFSLVEEAGKYESADVIFINYVFAATFHDYVTWLGSIIG